MTYITMNWRNLLPILNSEDLNKYLKLHYEDGNLEAREILIVSNLKLVVKEAYKYSNGHDTEEFFDAGIIGLINGVDTYDIKKGFKLSTYLVKCIDNSILLFIRKNKKSIKTVSLEMPITNDSGEEEKLLKDILVADSVDMDRQLQLEELCVFLEDEAVLNSRERKMIKMFFGFYKDRRYTQTEIANVFNISRVQVCAIIKGALIKLRKKIDSNSNLWLISKQKTISK